jgi:hypothetical protein
MFGSARLTDAHTLDGFDCGEESLNPWLIARCASRGQQRGQGYGEQLLLDAVGKAVAASATVETNEVDVIADVIVSSRLALPGAALGRCLHGSRTITASCLPTPMRRGNVRDGHGVGTEWE